MEPLKMLSMGWGVQTFTLAAMMALDAIPRVDHIVFSDTHHEAQATYDFARLWTPWLGEHGMSVVTVHPEDSNVVVDYKTTTGIMIPAFTIADLNGDKGQVQRQCTGHWKITPIRQFLRQEMERREIKVTPGAVECSMGISFDEWVRMRDSGVEYVVNNYPLIDMRMTRQDCILWLERHNLPVPPKSACTFCPFHSLATWGAIKRENGRDWREAVAVDTIIRDKRPDHGQLFVHPARQELAKAVDIPEDHGAYQAEMDVSCEGGYCMV